MNYETFPSFNMKNIKTPNEKASDLSLNFWLSNHSRDCTDYKKYL